MKRSTWAGIIGGLLLVIFLIGGGMTLVEPAIYKKVKIAELVTSLMWLSLGVFLVSVYVKSRRQEDSGTPLPLAGDLWYRRNRIFAYLLTIQFIGSASLWILNDYTVGFTLNNISVIFDLLINLSLVYFIVQLFKNKNVLRSLLCLMLLYGAGGGLIGFLGYDWSLAVSQMLIAAYFLYAIRTPLTPHSHRIAHFVLLPVFVAIAVVVFQFDDVKVNKMLDDQTRLEQEFGNISDDISVVYTSIIEDEYASEMDIGMIEQKLSERDEKIEDSITLLSKIEEEFRSQRISEVQLQSLDEIDLMYSVFKLHQEQGSKMREFIGYYKQINSDRISPLLREQINQLEVEIEVYNSEIRDLFFEFENR